MAIKFLSGVNVDQNTLFVDDANNSVGIGTTSPASKLHVLGNVTIGSIGTTAPQEPLMVKTATAAYFPGIKVENYNSEVGLYIQNIDGYNAGIGTGRYYNSGFWRSDLTVPTSVRFDQGVIRFYAQSGVTADVDYVASERMRITAAGNVGIGTTIPTEKLTVDGNILLTDSLNQERLILFRRNSADVGKLTATALGIQLQALVNKRVSIVDDSNNGMHIVDGGNVGIGTTAPARKLSIYDASSNTVGIELSNGTSTTNIFHNRIDSQWFTGALAGDFGFRNDAGAFAVAMNNEAKLYVNQSGNVGIGTTSPSEKLHVNDTSRFVNNTTNSLGGALYTGTKPSSWLFPLETGSTMRQTVIGQATTAGTALPQLNNYGGVGIIGVGGPNTGGRTNIGVFGYQYFSQNMSANTNNRGYGGYFLAKGIGSCTDFKGEYIGVYGEGNIGTDTVESTYGSISGGRFVAVGTTNQTTYGVYAQATGGTTNYSVYAPNGNAYFADNVGIGTSSPSQKLEVAGSINLNAISYAYKINGLNVVSASAAYTSLHHPEGGVAIYLGDSADRTNYYDNSAHRFRNAGGVSDYMVINSSGNVGIGTTSPAYKLDVRTSAAGNYAYFGASSDGGQRGLVFTSADNGIYLGAIHTINASSASGMIALATGGNERMRINSAGYVGIGTTSPTTLLNVYSATVNRLAEFKSGDNGALIEISDDDTTSYVGSEGSLTYIGQTASASANNLIINGSGNVGIGTTSPTHKLHVVGSVNIENDLTFGIGGFLGTSTSEFEMFSLGDIIYNADSNNNGDSNHIFRESGNELMRITSAGNVGIGITSPLALLDIAKTTGASLLIRNGDDSIGSNNRVQIRFSFNGTNNYSHFITSRHNSGAVDGNALDFYVGDTTSGGTYPTNAIHNLTLNGGKVGIGTTAPDRPLHIYTSSVDSNAQIILQNDAVKYYIGPAGTDSDNFNIYYDNGSRTAFSIQSDGDTILVPSAGNVGIGTTSPTEALHVEDSTSIQLRFNQSGASTSTRIGSGTSYFQLATGTGGATPSIVVLHSNQNVGIGTTSPAYKLDVNGTFRAVNNSVSLAYENGIIYHGGSYYQFPSGSYYYLYGRAGMGLIFGSNNAEVGRFDLSGNLGIGTTSPNQKLDVNGTIGIKGAAFATNDATYTSIFKAQSNSVGIYLGGAADPSNYYDNDYHYFRSSGAVSTLGVWNAAGLGIGTTSPSQKLQVSAGDIMIDSGYAMHFTTTADFTKIQRSNNALQFFTNSTGMLSLNDDGSGYFNGSANFGIGTTSPSQRLHVSGNLRVTGAYYDSNNEAGTSGQVLTSTGTGTDWKSLAEITGVDGTGTANYVAKWSDADSITNSQIQDNGTTVGVGVAPSSAKLTVAGSIEAGGKAVYTKTYGSIDTTGQAVAGISAAGNGGSALFQFTCNGGSGEYQKIIYACHNVSGTWFTRKVVDEGTNALDVVASANGATITFTFKGRTSSQSYSPRVLVEITGNRDASYL